MEFLFRHRGEGKRQVKPSQDIALLEDQIAGESSDDSDFVVEEKKSGKKSAENSDVMSSDSDDDDDSDDSDNSSEDETDSLEGEAANLKKAGGLATSDLLAVSKGQLASTASDKLTKDIKVCGCCLGSSSSDANEIVECDGCGISVHEGCYGVSESGSVASTISSASTEPWFCEPCRAGVMTPPPCELCPVLGGVYKETEVGRWVHLVCALYVPGVAFGDTDKMCHVTIFEMNYSMWGRKVCMLCSSQDDGAQTSGLTGGVRLARTGVCIQCDAGLCRSFFHASCAQAAGLLTEPTYATTAVGHVDDTYLAHCRLHSDRQVVRKRRRAFLIFHINYKRRNEEIRAGWANTKPMSTSQRLSSRALPNELPEERILRKLYRKQAGYSRDKAASHDPWLPTQKLPRLLTTSASAIRKLQRLQECATGISVERQQKHEVQLQAVAEAKRKWHVPPGFSIEFTAYYEDREKRLVDLKGQVEDDLELNRELSNQDSDVRRKYDVASKAHDESLQENNRMREMISTYRSVLEKLGSKLPPESSLPDLKPLVKSFEIVTPNIMARATVYSQYKTNKHVTAAGGTPTKINICAVCKKTHDQHLLAHCDTCKLHYHLSCLTPPLTRMPKKSKLYGWSCSECYPHSTSDEEGYNMDQDQESIDDATKKRNRSRRLAASKALVANSDFDWPTQTGSMHAYSDESKTGTPPSVPRKRGRKPGSHGSSGKKAKTNSSRTQAGGGGGEKDDDDVEILTPMPETSSLHDEMYATNGSSEDQKKSKQQLKMDKDAAKAMRKEAKRAEKMKRKEEKKLQKKLLKEQRKKLEVSQENEEHEEDGLETEDEEVEIVEDESGQCTVRIKPKPIKLKINLPKEMQDQSAATASGNLPTATASSKQAVVADSSDESATPSRRTSTTSKGSGGNGALGGGGGAGKGDKRTQCDKCSGPGSNANLVRCDECRKCYHFDCLVPPVKKSPKVAGWSWHCIDCDPSDVDSDWHLD